MRLAQQARMIPHLTPVLIPIREPGRLMELQCLRRDLTPQEQAERDELLSAPDPDGEDAC